MEKLLKTAISAALKAGEEILNIYNDPRQDFEVEHKADHSPLTLADKRAHNTILEFLKDTPYPVLSEEGKLTGYEERQTWKTLWIVDPLDGTKEFIKRNGEFTVNIALISDTAPILGVIYIPVRKELYYGTLTAGAFKNTGISYTSDIDFDNLQSTATPLPIGKANTPFIVVVSRSHMSAETGHFIEELRKIHTDVALTSVGSSIKICLVAEGSADIYPRFAPTMEWDTAAGHAIAKAAGKEVYRKDGKTPLDYNKSDLLNPWFIVK